MNFQPAHWRRQRSVEKLILAIAFSVLLLVLVPATMAEENLPAPTTAQPNGFSGPVRSAQPPNQATVSWGSHGLKIEASNSSLNQILRQVAGHTGAKLEGLRQDQRVFGNYGPGPASDVLLMLLDGSSYNVLIIGGLGADPPLEIVLSARSPAGSLTANNQNHSKDDAAIDPEPQPQPESQPVQNPFLNGNDGLPHDPTEFMKEILDRQHKIDEQQQQQQKDQQNDPQ
jgi:hypothetical protein